MKKIDTIILLVYLVVGIFVCTIDSYVAPVFLTVLPFQYLYLKCAIKTNNLFFVFLAICLFLSHGIGSVTFFMNRENESSVGFNAIGSFDFSYYLFFEAYSYLFVFQIVLLVVFAIQKKKYHKNYIKPFFEEEIKLYTINKRPYGVLPILFLTILFSIISLWMYSLHIGMIGLHQTRLPFHLTGILFNLRRYIFPLVLLIVFVRTNNQVLASVAMVFYAFIAGVSGTSKSLSLILLVPTIFLCYVSNHKNLARVIGIVTIIVYMFVGDARVWVYMSDAELSISDIIVQSYNSFFAQSFGDFVFNFVDGICNRLYGIRSTVLTNQYSFLSIRDLVDFYLMKDISEIIPDISSVIYGMNLPDDKAYGVSFGYNGTFQLLCCRSYFFAVLQGLLISLVAGWQNSMLQRVFRLNGNRKGKYIMFLSFLISFYSFFPGHNVIVFYGVTAFMFIYSLQIIKKSTD